MFQIKLDSLSSYDDLELKCESLDVPAPSPRQVYLSISGMDGEYNMTELVHGRVTFEPLTITAKFTYCHGDTEYAYRKKCAQLNSLTLGKTMKITLDSDSEHYYEGEVSWQHSDGFHVSTHTMTAVCFPYRYLNEETVLNYSINGTTTITLTNTRMPVQPIFETESTSIQLIIDSTYHSITNDTQCIIDELYLDEGDTTITLTGSGDVTIRYRQGEL